MDAWTSRYKRYKAPDGYSLTQVVGARAARGSLPGGGMNKLLRCVVFLAFAVGMATPSEAFIGPLLKLPCKLIECPCKLLADCPALRKLKAQCRGKKAAKAMKAKKPLFGGHKRDCDHSCDCPCDCECDCPLD